MTENNKLFSGALVKCSGKTSEKPKYGYLVRVVSKEPEIWKVMLISEDVDMMEAQYHSISEIGLVNQSLMVSIKRPK